MTESTVHIIAGGITLEGNMAIPARAHGIVLFAHGTGSSRHSPRNRFVAAELQRRGLATLLLDLLTVGEEAVDMHTRQHRFDIGLLADRLVATTEWLGRQADTRDLPLGYFGASTGAGAALVAAAARPDAVAAVVSRGGRPDLAGDSLPLVKAPVLLIVGGDDTPVLAMNREASARMHAENRIVIVPGASHLFEEPGKIEEVARLAGEWFVRHLSGAEGEE
jgi:putative phosphoribosyl transferase